MRVRQLSSSGDMQFGRGGRDFIRDEPEVVAQRAETRLALYQGDWFLNPRDGTPWRTKVLGRRTDATRDPALQARILGTPGCTKLVSYASQLGRGIRAFSVQAVIATQFDDGANPTPIAVSSDDVRLNR